MSLPRKTPLLVEILTAGLPFEKAERFRDLSIEHGPGRAGIDLCKERNWELARKDLDKNLGSAVLPFVRIKESRAAGSESIPTELEESGH